MKLSTRPFRPPPARGAWRNEAGRKPDLAKAGHGGPLTDCGRQACWKPN